MRSYSYLVAAAATLLAACGPVPEENATPETAKFIDTIDFAIDGQNIMTDSDTGSLGGVLLRSDLFVLVRSWTNGGKDSIFTYASADPVPLKPGLYSLAPNNDHNVTLTITNTATNTATAYGAVPCPSRNLSALDSSMSVKNVWLHRKGTTAIFASITGKLYDVTSCATSTPTKIVDFSTTAKISTAARSDDVYGAAP